MGVCLCECIIEDVKAVKVNKQKMRGADTLESFCNMLSL